MSKREKKQAVKRIELPFEEALERSTKQNFDTDVRLKRCKKKDWDALKYSYSSTARMYLIRDGENKKPTPPDTEHYVLSPT